MKIESDQCCEIFFLSTLLLMKDQGSSYRDVLPSIFLENPEIAVQCTMIHYLKNKVGVVDFANDQGVVMF